MVVSERQQSLQRRWLWIEKTKLERSWAGLKIPFHMNTSVMFAISVVTSVAGKSENTMFWTDWWIHGCHLQDLAPNVFKSVPPRLRNKRTVAEPFLELTWIADIWGAIDWHSLAKYLQLWDMLSNIALNDNTDAHQWMFEPSGNFSTRSAYRAFFIGSTSFEPWKWIWKTWAQGK